MKYIKWFKNKKTHKVYTINDVIFAIKNRDVEELEKVANKDNINTFSDYGTTALNYAIYKNDYNIINKLIELGVNINLQKKSDKKTALMYAAHRWDYKTIKKLLNLGADPHLTDIYDNSFIDYIDDDDILNNLKTDFPELYQEHVIKKNTEKYNL